MPSENSKSSTQQTNGAASPPKRKRLNLDLSPDAYDLLQKLADESGKNMADVLRTGLALYGIAQDERKKGRSLGVVNDDKVVKEIVIP
ncbi:hypothetical protein IFO70_02980 [Phormidium tenue FACHB-886]|nr:hypothetical protein [Phormidium tenue FACHB-886]